MALKIDNAKNILVLTETTSPGTPEAGTLAIYADTSGSLRIVDDAGADSQLLSSGSPIISGATALSELSDVALGSPLSTDEVLTYNGTSWVNQIAEGGTSVFTESGTNLYGGTNTTAGGGHNFVAGYNAGAQMTGGGTHNVFIGSNAGRGTSNSDKHVFIGAYAGGTVGNITGSWHTVIGYRAGEDITSNGYGSVIIGAYAGRQCTTEKDSVIIGLKAGNQSTTQASANNVVVGGSAGGALGSNANNNVIVGRSAGAAISTGDSNVLLGFSAGPTTNTDNQLFINNSQSDTPLIHGDFSTNVVTINGDLTVTGTSPSGTLSELSDVALGSPLSTDEVLTYDGNNWVNQAAAGGEPAHQVTFTFDSSTTAGDPGTNEIRFDNATPINVTRITFNDTSLEGLDIGKFVGQLTLGDQIYIKQLNDDTKYLFGIVDQESTDQTGYWYAYVDVGTGYGGTIPDNGATVGIMKVPGQSVGRIGTGNIVGGVAAGTGASYNICIGDYAGSDLSTSLATENVIIGQKAGRGITSSDRNVVIGKEAIGNSASSMGGYHNVVIGRRAGYDMTSAPNSNVVIGHSAGREENGTFNIVLGFYAGNQTSSTSGSQSNIIVGQRAGSSTTNGDFNTFFGAYAGGNISTGSNNICIGRRAGPTTNVSQQLFIDYNTSGFSDTPLIHGDFSTGDVTINGNLTVTGTVTGVDVAPSHEKIIIGGSPVSNTITTTVTLTETAGSPIQTAYVQVFRNGMLMDEDLIGGSPLDITEDYAVIDANTIIFADGILEVNDKIKIYVFG